MRPQYYSGKERRAGDDENAGAWALRSYSEYKKSSWIATCSWISFAVRGKYLWNLKINARGRQRDWDILASLGPPEEMKTRERPGEVCSWLVWGTWCERKGINVPKGGLWMNQGGDKRAASVHSFRQKKQAGCGERHTRAFSAAGAPGPPPHLHSSWGLSVAVTLTCKLEFYCWGFEQNMQWLNNFFIMVLWLFHLHVIITVYNSFSEYQRKIITIRECAKKNY